MKNTIYNVTPIIPTDSNRLDTSKINSAKDIPVGTILTQYWCNWTSAFMVVKTTAKTVTVLSLPEKNTHFEHDGGGTGHNYSMPDFDRLKTILEKNEAFEKKYGFSKINQRSSSKLRENLSDAGWKEYWDLPEATVNTKIVKNTKDGGICIPGVYQGFMCGNMNLWNGKELVKYYAD